jgi:hypothetical protein
MPGVVKTIKYYWLTINAFGGRCTTATDQRQCDAARGRDELALHRARPFPVV